MGIYVGVLGALWLYTLFIYRSLREQFLKPYLLFVGSMLILVPSLNGAYDYALGRYLWEWFHFTDLIALTTALVCYAGTRFAQEFMQSSVYSLRLCRIQRIWSRVCLGAAFLSLPPIYFRFPEITGNVNDGVLVITAVLIVIAGIIGVRDRVKAASIFLAAWVSFLVSVLIFLLSTHGWIANNVFTRSIVEVGNLTEMLLLAWAITGRVKEMERDLIQSIQKALHIERMENLVKMICHDLSSPLQVVSAHAQVGKMGGPGSWEAVERAVHEQDQLVDFVKRHGSVVGYVDSGKLTQVRIPEVTETLNFLFHSRARQKGIELRLPSEEQLRGLSVLAEAPSLVHSVVGNAITNAIKFSEPGAWIGLEVEADSNWVTLHVVDQGRGITRELQEKIRARSHGIQRLGTQGETGTGYGLQLMKHFVESYGGVFRWESRAREDGFSETGSRMTFQLKRFKG
jgi:signal transduction histidine kinase